MLVLSLVLIVMAQYSYSFILALVNSRKVVLVLVLAHGLIGLLVLLLMTKYSHLYLSTDNFIIEPELEELLLK